MKLSLYSSIGWRHPLGLSYVASMAAACGYEQISIRGRSTDTASPSPQQIRAVGYDMLSPEESSTDGLAALNELFTSYGVGPYCISTYASLVHPDEAVRADSALRIRRGLALAKAIGAPVLRTIGHVTGSAGPGSPERAERASWFVAGLRALAPVAEDAGVLLQIENAESSFPLTADEVNWTLRELGFERIVVAYDPVNSFFSGLDPKSEFERLERVPGAIHVKDVAKVGDGFRWTEVGKGDVPWVELLAMARERGFDGTFVCEYVNPHKLADFHGWEQLTSPEGWARGSAEFLRGLF